MSYILIQNDGEIELGAFELIGASTKRNQSGKIGFFGSGLKYSIAYMMRSGIDFKVFSGEKELIFTKKEEILRDQKFERICINGVPTSYTTTMGPTWKEAWFVVREIYCNALDETNCQIVKSTDSINPAAGKTRIYLELVPEFKSMIENWDAYFSGDREPIFEKETYTSFLGTNDIGGKSIQLAKVFKKTEGVVYRKGVRVYSGKRLGWDYEFEFAEINEDRTLKSTSGLDYVVASMVGSMVHEEYVASVLRQGDETVSPFEYYAISYNKPQKEISSDWIEFSKKYLLVVKDVSGRYAEQIRLSKKEPLLIPTMLAKELKKALPDCNILGIGKASGDVFMTDVDGTPKINYLLKDVLKQLAEMKYPINYQISVVHFEDDTILGHADIKEKQIYIAEKVFDMGRREIAMTLIEENEHIISGHGDETRAFQTHLISQNLKHMEETAGLFL